MEQGRRRNQERLKLLILTAGWMLIYFGIEMTEVGVVWNRREIKVSVLDMLTLKSIFDV